jgi:hypothetical protein
MAPARLEATLQPLEGRCGGVVASLSGTVRRITAMMDRRLTGARAERVVSPLESSSTSSSAAA